MMASSRPHRKCVRRLSDEAINDILSDTSDASDDPDDPDFEVESDSNHHRGFLRGTPKRLRPSDSNSSDSNSSAPPPAAAKTQHAEVPRPVARPSATPTPSVSTLDELNIEPHTPTTPGVKYICCVTGCSSGSLSNVDGLWLYPLPEEKELLEAWNREVQPIDLDANRPRSPRICFRHFDTTSFVRRQQRLLGLKKGAVPSAAASTAALSPAANSTPRRSGGYSGRTLVATNNVMATPPQAIAASPHTPAAEGPRPALPAPPQPTVRTEKVITPSVTPRTGMPLTPAMQTYVKRPVHSPVVVGRGAVVPVAMTPAKPGPLKPQTELFIDLTAEEVAAEDRKVSEVVVADGTAAAAAAGAGTTNGPKVAAHASFSVAVHEPDQILGMDYAAEDGYVLTLEDVEEELPWVVPDMHWNSDLVDGELHLVWNNSPNGDCCKKVVLGQDMRVKVFVGKTQVVLGVRQVTNMASLKALFMELSKL